MQAPISFRVAGFVLTHLLRAADGLASAISRALTGVTDSPAFLDGRFVGTAGFHGLDLVSWIFDPLQKSSERFEYFFRGFRPDEWPGVFVPFVHPGQDVLLELPDGLVHPAAQ